MNFNIYLDPDTGQKLQKLAKRKRLTRNALIRKAVQELVQNEERSDTWSPEVLEWEGEPATEPFESHRLDLRPIKDDPLA